MATGSGIHINFTEDELQSEARTYEDVPSGEYVCNIFKIEQKEVKQVGADGKPNKNAGKPFWNLQLKIAESRYEGKVLFANVMLFNDPDKGGAFLLSQLLKSTGHQDALKSGNIPAASEFEGQKVTAVVLRAKDKYAMKGAPPGAPIAWRTDVKGFRPASAGKVTASGGNSLAP